MAPRLTKFSPTWLEKMDPYGNVVKTWCRATDNEFEAFCIPCKFVIKVGNQGFSQILSHAKSGRHKKASGSMKNQSTFSPTPTASGNSRLLVLKSANGFIQFSLSEKILKAEVFLVLIAVKNNYSFSSLTDLSQIYGEIFEDSDIAKGIKLSDKKVRYVLNFGIAPYFKSLLFKDIEDSYYAIHFDETTTKQTKKQLDICISYWSKMKGKIVYSYCDSYFLGHADADTILKNLLCFIEQSSLKIEKLVQISMDGPNVNLSLRKKLDNTLNLKSLPPLINIGTCYLHVIHNALRKGLCKLDFDIDKFALDIHQWFKLSPARREDFHCLQVEMLDEVFANHVFMRHVDTRWLTLGPVCDRLIEQYDVLKQYFLKECVLHVEGSNSERYNRIVSCLKKSSTVTYLHFISFLTSLFKPYMLILQKETPIVHILYTKLNDFVRSIFFKFIKTAVVGSKTGTQLLDIIPSNAESWVQTRKIDIGHAAKNTVNEEQSFFLSVRSCYITIATYLLKKLPISNPFLKDVQCLCPSNRKKTNSKMSACRLPQHLPQISSFNNLSDKIGEEYIIYMCDDNLSNLIDNYNIDHEICKYWDEVSKMKDCSGILKYANLSLVAKVCLTLTAANAQPERGFSVNNSIVTKDRSSLSELCIKSLRMCRDFIRQNDNDISCIKFTKQFISYVRKSHAEYSAYQDQQKEQKSAVKRKHDSEKAAELDKKRRKFELEEEINKLHLEEKQLLSDQNAAQKLLNETKSKLTQAVQDNNMSEVKIAQMMLSAANTEMQSVNKKLTDCCSKQEQLKQKIKN